MYTNGPYSDMPRTITYVGDAGDDNLIQFAQQQELSGLWKKLRKMRPSKWKPKQFVKAAAIVGAGVVLGPLAAAGAAKAYRRVGGLITKSGQASAPVKVPAGMLRDQALKAAQRTTEEYIAQQEAPNSKPLTFGYPGPRTAGFGGAMPLLAIAALFLMSKKGR